MEKLTFRPIDWQDAGPLFVWRTDVDTARHSFRLPPTWEQHLKWFNREVTDPSTFVGVRPDGVPVCMIAVKMTDGDYDDSNEINIMVNPELRRMGYAGQAIVWAQTIWYRLIAKVKIGNTAGVRLFVKHGFTLVGVEEEPAVVVLKWDAPQ